jgi:hypothetical protein
MAVARFRFTPREYRYIAVGLPPRLWRLAREFERAAERYGHSSEVTGEEARALAALAPTLRLPEHVATAIYEARDRVAMLEIKEREGAARLRRLMTIHED